MVSAVQRCAVSGVSIAAQSIREMLGVVSTFVPCGLIRPNVTVEEVRA